MPGAPNIDARLLFGAGIYCCKGIDGHVRGASGVILSACMEMAWKHNRRLFLQLLWQSNEFAGAYRDADLCWAHKKTKIFDSQAH